MTNMYCLLLLFFLFLFLFFFWSLLWISVNSNFMHYLYNIYYSCIAVHSWIVIKWSLMRLLKHCLLCCCMVLTLTVWNAQFSGFVSISYLLLISHYLVISITSSEACSCCYFMCGNWQCSEGRFLIWNGFIFIFSFNSIALSFFLCFGPPDWGLDVNLKWLLFIFSFTFNSSALSFFSLCFGPLDWGLDGQIWSTHYWNNLFNHIDTSVKLCAVHIISCSTVVENNRQVVEPVSCIIALYWSKLGHGYRVAMRDLSLLVILPH